MFLRGRKSVSWVVRFIINEMCFTRSLGFIKLSSGLKKLINYRIR